MLLLKCLIVLITLQNYCHNTYGQPDLKFFRKDYKYIEDTKSFYKIHTVQKTWEKAKEQCAMEGSTLFYAEDDDEAMVVSKFLNETQPGYWWVYVGISTPIVKNVFETVDGLPITDVYNNWGPGEPNDAGGEEGCVIMRTDTTLNDDHCERNYPFICKKTLDSLEWNMLCDIPYSGYEYVENIGRCYKFHMTPKTWSEAYATCSAEQSFLAVINSQEEANFLVNLTSRALQNKVEGDYVKGAVHLGFFFKKKWQTVTKNLPLSESGYMKWGGGQPDGKGNEQCGSMFHNGSLNDIGCEKRLLFICEHEIDLLRNSQVLRFGDVFTVKP